MELKKFRLQRCGLHLFLAAFPVTFINCVKVARRQILYLKVTEPDEEYFL